jgi:hypothetical protein
MSVDSTPAAVALHPASDASTMEALSAAAAAAAAVKRSLLAQTAAAGDIQLLSISGKRIMLMEDDDRLYSAIKDTLEDFGCEIMGSCARICGPLEMVPSSHLDAALIDLERLSVERSSAIVTGLHDRGVPVVLITYLTADNLPRALQGCARLLKPFTSQQMLSGLATVIEGGSHAVSV